MNARFVCPDALMAALFAASVAHWLAVLPFAEAWLGVGSGEPRPDGFVLKVWWFLHPVMNADSVQPCVFPDALTAR